MNTIYNQELTDSLNELFEKDVSTWSKTKIRNEIENQLEKAKSEVLAAVDNREDCLNIYQYIKRLDNEFMVHYMAEVDAKINN